MSKKYSICLNSLSKSCDEVCMVFKALSHPQRLLILGHLISKSKTVGELVNECEISQSQMSQFLSRMKLEGLVKSTKTGKFQFYEIADKRLAAVIRTVQKEYCN